MQLGKRIASRLKALGLTQRQLADRTGLTQPAISKYVRDKTKPSYEVIVKLSEVLGVHPGWFFPESEPPEPSSRRTSQWGVSSPVNGDVIVFPTSGKSPQRTTLVIGHWVPMQHVPPPIHPDSHSIFANFYELIFNKLVRIAPPGQLRGALAIDWKPVGDSWVFQLREGVRFHNGNPLMAEDVRWSYQQYLRETPQEHRIEGVEVLDAHFVQIHLKSPSRLEDLPMPFILPEGTRAPFTEWMGTGPFQAIELNPGFWRLRRNPYYFLPQPYFREIQIREYPDSQSLERALVEGNVHFAVGIHYSGRDTIAKAEPATQRYHLHFMLEERLVQNRWLRQAISLALDKAALAKAAGLKNPLYSPGPFDSILRDRSHTPPFPQKDVAVQLLQRVPELRDSVLRVKYYPTVPQSRLLAEAIVEQLKGLGIEAEIGDDPHLLLVTRPVDTFDRESAVWLSSDRQNLNSYSHPEVDTHIEELRTGATTPAQLLELRQLIQSDLPDIPLFYSETPLTYVKQLRALENRVVLLSYLNEIHTWYLDEATAAKERKERENSTASIA